MPKPFKIAIILLIATLFAGCTNPFAPSRQEIIDKISEGNDLFRQTGFLNTSEEDLVKSVGKPDNRQEIDGSIIFYYECSDGTVQILANRHMYRLNKSIMGKVNLL